MIEESEQQIQDDITQEDVASDSSDTKENLDLDTLDIDHLPDDDILEIAKRFNFKTKDQIKNPGTNYIDDPKAYLAHLKSDYPLLKATAATIATTNRKLQKQNEEHAKYIKSLEEQINSVKQLQNSFQESSLQQTLQALDDKKDFLRKKLDEAISNGDAEAVKAIFQQTEDLSARKIDLKAKIDTLASNTQQTQVAPADPFSHLPTQVKEFLETDGAWYKDPALFPQADQYLNTLMQKDPSISIDEQLYKLRQWRKRYLDNIDTQPIPAERGARLTQTVNASYRNSTARPEDRRGLTPEQYELFELIKKKRPSFTKERFLQNLQNE